MKALLFFFSMMAMATGFSQESGKLVESGNSDFKKGNFAEAEAKYRIAHSQNTANSSAYYNLGNSIYRQGTGSEAKYAYAKAIDVAKTKEERHRAYHNLGNIFLKEKDYNAAVEAYKDALRNNPYDEETRYNYALARKKAAGKSNLPPPFQIKDRDKNQDRKKSDKEQKSDSPEGKGNERDMAGNSGEKQHKQDTPGDDKEGKSGMGNRDDMPASQEPSEQRIKQILDAVNNEEKKVMDRVNSKKSPGDPAQPEKDW